MEEAKDDIQLYISEPQKFFEKISGEGLGKAIIVYLITSIIGVTLSIVINFSMTSFSNSYYSLMSMTFIAIALPVIFIIGFGLNFIFGGITHFFARLVFSGTATYPETMKVYFYSMLPTALLGALPFGLGFLALIYSIILGTIGISKTHNIGYGKSFVSVIAPWVLILILFISLIILAMGFYMGF